MKKLFEELMQRIEKEEPSVLVCVVESKGSVPRAAGAYMLAGDKGRVWGTIGGGRLEYEAIEAAKGLIKQKKSYIHTYSLGEMTSELGMVCGGSARVLFYYVDHTHEKDRGFVAEGLKAASGRRPYYISLPLEGGKARIEYELCQREGYYTRGFKLDGTVYIFGGGHIARETVPLLKRLGFSVVVTDDREEFANKGLFPDADEVMLSDFHKLSLDKLHIGENDYIAIMTRGHAGDALCEEFALKTSAKYIGVVGSRAKTEFVNRQLREKGVTEEQLSRVITPIGIDIGSSTPEEIAVSIAAQLIQKRSEKE